MCRILQWLAQYRAAFVSSLGCLVDFKTGFWKHNSHNSMRTAPISSSISTHQAIFKNGLPTEKCSPSSRSDNPELYETIKIGTIVLVYTQSLTAKEHLPLSPETEKKCKKILNHEKCRTISGNLRQMQLFWILRMFSENCCTVGSPTSQFSCDTFHMLRLETWTSVRS